MYLFKPKGAGTFLQTHGFLFLKDEYSDTTMLYYLNSNKSTKWTDHPKMVKILTSPQEWTNHPKKVKVLKVHKVDGLHQRG